MSFSDLLHKVKYYLGISVLLQIAIFNSFLWLGNISFVCVCVCIHMCVCVCVCVCVYSCCCSVFATPWTAARQASLSLTISRSLPKFMSIAMVMPSSHLILWCPLLLLLMVCLFLLLMVCLFLLLMVSFAASKLLNLNTSHLFIFAFTAFALGEWSKKILV